MLTSSLTLQQTHLVSIFRGSSFLPPNSVPGASPDLVGTLEPTRNSSKADLLSPPSSPSITLSARKFRRIRTCENYAHKPCGIRTYEKNGRGRAASNPHQVGQPILAVASRLSQPMERGSPATLGPRVPLRCKPQSARITPVAQDTAARKHIRSGWCLMY
jgi:hypothetical protein